MSLPLKSLAVVIFAVSFSPAWGDETQKQAECQLQGEIIGTIQQARLDGVRKAKLQAAVAEARPDLSEAVLATVPQLGNFVYDIRKRDLRKMDLNAVTREQCLQNWEQIQALKNNISD